MSGPVCVVVGVGKGIGESLVRTYAKEGYRMVLMARTEAKIAALAEEVGGLAVPCDATDEASIEAAFAKVAADLGTVHTLLWNVGSGVFGDLDAIEVAGMELAWRTNTLGLFVAAKQVVSGMRDAGEGAILVTGATASRRGKPFTTAFAAGKAAQRSLCQSLARQLWPQGIHVALVVVDGMVQAPDRDAIDVALLPDDIATTFLHLSKQPSTAWTFELEVRPHRENW
ncbi:MAG: SDR family NAD(P)-dependent oxidoreductase [Myxococcota bacterium]